MLHYLRFIVVLGCLGSAIFLLTCSAASQTVASAADTQLYKIEGRVINALNGRPVPRALVEWNGFSGQVSMLTGPDGEFSFDGVPAGRNQILAQKPGYLTGLYGQKRVMFVAGPDSGKLTVKLLPEAVISGRVLGKDNEPLENAGVRIERAGRPAGPRAYLRQNATRTDEDGNFRLTELPAGQYVISVQPGNAARRILGNQSEKTAEAYPVIVYYPAATDEASAEPLALTAGQHSEVNFSITTRSAYQVNGTVRGAAEWKQISSPHFVDRRGQIIFSAQEFNTQTGAFTFRDVPAGNYTIRVTGMDQTENQSIIQQRVTVLKDVTGMSLSLRPTIEVLVNVRKEMTSTTRNPSNCSYTSRDGVAHTSDCSDYPPFQLELRPADSPNDSIRSNWVPPAGDTLMLRGLRPGRYKVHVNGGMIQNASYIASLSCGLTDLLREELVVPESGQLPAIEAVIRDDFGTLHLLVNAEPKTFGTVSLLSDSDEEPMNRWSFSTDSMVNMPLAPGKYKVLAIADTEDIDPSDPEATARFFEHAATVTVVPGKAANLVVDLTHTGE